MQRQGPPVCLHNRPIEGECRDCEIETGCAAGSPCPCPNLQPLTYIELWAWLLAFLGIAGAAGAVWL